MRAGWCRYREIIQTLSLESADNVKAMVEKTNEYTAKIAASELSRILAAARRQHKHYDPDERKRTGKSDELPFAFTWSVCYPRLTGVESKRLPVCVQDI